MQVLAAMRVEDKRDSLGGSQVPSYTAGFQPPWSVQGPCHKQRFMSHPVPTAASNNPDTSESVGGILANVAQELFASEAFAKWLMCITELAPKALNAQVCTRLLSSQCLPEAEVDCPSLLLWCTLRFPRYHFC